MQFSHHLFFCGCCTWRHFYADLGFDFSEIVSMLMLYFKDCVRWHFQNCNFSQALLNCCTFCAFSNLVKTSRHFCKGKDITTKNWIYSTFVITSLVQTMKVDLHTTWFWCFEPKLIKFSISSLKIQTLSLKHHERNHSRFI